MKQVSADTVVIGSGIAGLTYALKAARLGSVAIVTKKQRADSNTNYAQGGVAAVFDPGDSTVLHARDTLVAGCGLCHSQAVRALVRDGPQRVRELADLGVAFTRAGEAFSLGREGGHTRRRIVHAGDLTGREIERALLQALSEQPAVAMYEDHMAIDLVVGHEQVSGRRRCAGLLALDHRHGEFVAFQAAVVMIASGGMGQVYLHTTNPDIATGDGVAMAKRAGAAVANLEFVQFHPTALYPAGERAFLISEAVRGEGAILRRIDGSPLMEGVHPLGSLAPRNVVARAIDLELKNSGAEWVLLDLSSITRDALERRFPGIAAECEQRGFRLPADPLPVVPAAHYACGGILTDAAGRTSIAGLYATGEAACTGVHGANRLASNSLLEAVVYSHRAALELPSELARGALRPVSASFEMPVTRADVAAPQKEVGGSARFEAQSGGPLRDAIRRVMWEDAGIVRSSARLAEATREIDRIRSRFVARFENGWLDSDAIEVRNLLDTAALILTCARRRRESRGLHHNLDHPYRDNEKQLRDTILAGDER